MTALRRHARAGIPPAARILPALGLLVLGGLLACNPVPPVTPLERGVLDPAVQRLIAERIEAARARPDEAALRGSLGLAYEANALWPEAEQSFANAAELDPDEPLWRYHRSIALRALGRFDASLALLREVVRDRPDSAPFQHRLGEALLEAGQAAAALAPLERASELAPRRPEGFVGRGAALIELGDDEAAEALLVHALTLDRSHKRTRYLLGLAYRGQGKEQEAAAQLALGLEAKTRYIPDELEGERLRAMVSFSDRFERAIRLSERGNTKRALGILEQLYETEPDNVAVLNNLAATHMRSGELRQAYELLTTARDLDPTNPTTWINMSNCLTAMGVTRGALEHADQAIELAPGLPNAHLERGRVLLAAKKAAEAHASLSTAARLDPQLAEAQELLADVCLTLDRKAEALAHLEALVRLLPEDLAAWLDLGFLALELAGGKDGDTARLELATRALQSARRLAPEDPKVRDLGERWAAFVE